MRRLLTTSRGRPCAALAAVVAACAALGGAAWLVSPTPSALGHRVEARLRGTGGRAIQLSKMPLILQHAVVATEDERFYRHHGIDVIGVLRALPYDITHLSLAQGASTITEQVAKVLYLDGNDHNPWRKLEDAAVAVKLENRYSKATILAAYLNSAYFGEKAYGVQAAAERYFGLPGALARSGASDDARRPDPSALRLRPTARPGTRASPTDRSTALAAAAGTSPRRTPPPCWLSHSAFETAPCSRRSSTSTSHQHQCSSGGSLP